MFLQLIVKVGNNITEKGKLRRYVEGLKDKFRTIIRVGMVGGRYAMFAQVKIIRLYERASFSPDRLHNRPESARYLLTLVTACSDRDTHTLSKFS
jgi:hypothetical protein